MKPWRTDLADPSYAYRSSVFQGSWGEGIAGVNCRSEGAPITTEGGVSPQFTHKSPFLNLSPTDILGQRILCSVPGRVWQHSEPLLTRCQKRITTPRCDSYKRFRASQMCPRGKSIPAEKHCSHAEKAVAPTPALLPGKSHGWRSLVGRSPWGYKELDMTERLHFHFSLSCTGEGNGPPLQCSCLENPREGGAWWAAIYGVAQSWTRLK